MKVGHDFTLTHRVIGLAIEVHRHLGPGLLESAYEECLCCELEQARIVHERQVSLPLIYKTVHIERMYRIDIIVEQNLVLEIKSVEHVLPIHKATLLSYMRLLDVPLGLVLNFHEVKLVNGISRLILPGANQG